MADEIKDYGLRAQSHMVMNLLHADGAIEGKAAVMIGTGGSARGQTHAFALSAQFDRSRCPIVVRHNKLKTVMAAR